QHEAEVVLSLGEIRIRCERLSIVALRLLQPILVAEGKTQVVVDAGVIGLQSDRREEMADGLVHASLTDEHRPQIDVRADMRGLNRQRGEVLTGGLGPSTLVFEHSGQPIEDARVAWILAEQMTKVRLLERESVVGGSKSQLQLQMRPSI